MSRMSPIQDLNKEHQSLSANVNEIQAAAGELGTRGALSWREQARTLRDQIEMFHRALSLHFRREEEGLFPDAQSTVAEQGARGDALSQFFAEEGEDDINAHASLRTRVDDMLPLADEMARADAPDQQSLTRLRTLISTTRSLLERHAEKESRLIFPMIARALDDDQMEKVAARMAGLASAAELVDSSGQEQDELRGLDAQSD